LTAVKEAATATMDAIVNFIVMDVVGSLVVLISIEIWGRDVVYRC